MNEHENLFDSMNIHLSRTISITNTYIDVMVSISKKYNDFWDLIFNALYDLIIIESYKLTDTQSSGMSIQDLLKTTKTLLPQELKEIDRDIKSFNKFCKKLELTKHRHQLKAHIAKKGSNNLNKENVVYEISELLKTSQKLLEKYSYKITGRKQSVKFDSIYAGGHSEILNYIKQL